MRNIFRAERGVTLLEILLVLAIGGLIIVLSIRQYEVFKLGSDAEQIKANVDKIFQAASYFYQAQCRPNRPGTGDNNTLAPTVKSDPVTIDIQADLITGGYLSDNIPQNPLVDDQAAGTWHGYMAQFNSVATPRLICTSGTAASPSPGTDPNAPSCSASKQIGTVVTWQIQVSVVPKNSTLVQQLANMTASDCTTSIAVSRSASSSSVLISCTLAAGWINQCNQIEAAMNQSIPGSVSFQLAQDQFNGLGCVSGPRGNIISFQRNPSFSTAVDGQSGLGMDNKSLQQSTQSYQTDNINTLISESHTPETQYFTCGN